MLSNKLTCKAIKNSEMMAKLPVSGYFQQAIENILNTTLKKVTLTHNSLMKLPNNVYHIIYLSIRQDFLSYL
jgi:hypothetical protein